MKLKFLSVSLVLLILLAHFSTIAQSEQVDYTCTANPLIVQALSRTSQADYTAWIERLSGEVPVWVSNRQVSLDTRYTPAMFLTLANNARAFEFVEQQARSLMLHSQVAQHLFTMYAPAVFTAKNLVVDLPGATNPNEVVVLSAHLDSISTSSYSEAPGADDNATGSAALLEAVRLLRNLRFNRTIRFIWFTGEEQGLKGSYAYVNDPAVDLSQIVGVINLDMFGYDGDGDRCFELHVGTLPASNTVGQCFARVIAENALGLTHDFIEQGAIVASDHAPFWSKGVVAVEVLENYQASDLPGGCASTDINPNYHRVTDTLANMHPNYAFTIAKAAIAAAAGLAVLNQFDLGLLDFLIPVASAACLGGLILFYRPLNLTGWFILAFACLFVFAEFSRLFY